MLSIECFLLLSALGSHYAILASTFQDLEIWTGEKEQFVKPREENGQIYYRLREVAAILGLRLEERGNRLVVRGVQDELQLTDGRPLVRFAEEEYVLLSTPPIKKGKEDWYIPEDFLTRALPSILTGKVEKLGDQRYKIELQGQNYVQVEIANFGDRVRILLTPKLQVPIATKEFPDYIQVEVGEYPARFELPQNPPDRRIISSLELDLAHPYGALRIYKGHQYYSFRELTSGDLAREIIEVYGPPPTIVNLLPEEAPELRSAEPVADPRPSLPLPRSPKGGIVVDPGHGGENYGVSRSGKMLEKNITLEIASWIEQQLRDKGYQCQLTRLRDVDLPVAQRSGLGNYYRSTLYLSVHAGGSPSEKAHGPLVYVHKYQNQMSQTGVNDPLPEEGLTLRNPPSSGIDSDPRLVAWEEGQRAYLPQSRQLAELIQEKLNHVYGTNNRLVETPLAVLAPVAAPAALIEVGFMTNRKDGEKLSSAAFRERVAIAIVDGVLGFLKQRMDE